MLAMGIEAVVVKRQGHTAMNVRIANPKSRLRRVPSCTD